MNDQSFAKNTLVSSADVNGTDVFGRDGTNVGTIDYLMIDKTSGKVAYAMMRFGGFLGFGEDLFPIPWKSLTYDPAKSGFSTDITAEQLNGAPKRSDRWESDRAWHERTYDYWGLPYYWM
ncbi:MAG: PRC-barrel domain-containing protein [bacterium]